MIVLESEESSELWREAVIAGYKYVLDQYPKPEDRKMQMLLIAEEADLIVEAFNKRLGY